MTSKLKMDHSSKVLAARASVNCTTASPGMMRGITAQALGVLASGSYSATG